MEKIIDSVFAVLLVVMLTSIFVMAYDYLQTRRMEIKYQIETFSCEKICKNSES